MKDKDIKKNDINVLVISNILCMECDYNAQKRIGVLEQDTIVFDFIRFEEYFEKEIDYNGIDMAVIWINYESLFPDALISFLSNKDEFERKTSIICDLLKKLYVDVKRRCKGLVFFVGLEDYYIKITQIVGEIPLLGASIDRINLFVMDLLSREDYFVDLKKIISKIGLNNSYNEIWKYRWNATYSQALYFEVWKTIYGRFCSLYRNRIKCIIVDCDNVLWGGILAEDGIESIVLGTDDGRKFQDFQRYILALHYLGVSVCVCSKNNEEEVRRVFREHGGMVLKEDNIESFQVNWDSKVNGIKKLEKLLNIGLESMIFIDDSEHEINEVKALLPAVSCVLFDAKTIYKNLSFCLNSFVDSFNVKKRHEFYKTNVSRKFVEENCGSPEEYFDKLNTTVIFSVANKNESGRVVELLNRVNKRTIGSRLTCKDLDTVFEKHSFCHFTVYVNDMFSNLGIVGYICIYADVLISFALSCRAMGMGIERKMIDFAKTKGARRFVFIRTGKNDELFKLIEESGLVFTDESYDFCM